MRRLDLRAANVSAKVLQSLRLKCYNFIYWSYSKIVIDTKNWRYVVSATKNPANLLNSSL